MISRDEFVKQLGAVHGGALETIVLYGAAAADGAPASSADQNVLVIVSGLALSTLRALGQTVRAWQDAGNPPPLTLTRDEWHGSADIFPMEYSDILHRHRVLAGQFALDGIRVSREHLRLQIEQEAMGKLLRLRRGVMAAGTDGASQVELMRASYGSLVVLFRAVLRLHDDPVPADESGAIRTVAAMSAFDPAPFERVAALVRGTAIPAKEVEATLEGYVKGMESLVAHLDRFAPPPSAALYLEP